MKKNLLKIGNWKLKTADSYRGMTYIELIVVLSIFAVMSSVVIFNYGEFQAKVDIKNLANDIALKIVEAQKSSLFGKFPSLTQQTLTDSSWKPSYGVYININSSSGDNKGFVYFVDLKNPTQNSLYDGTNNSLLCTGGECVEKITITKGNIISSMDVHYLQDLSGITPPPTNIDNATLSFSRPSSTAVIKSTTALLPNIDYIQISITSGKSAQSNIKLYASGRVQIN